MQIKNNYQIEWEIRTKFGLCVDKGMGIFNGDTGIIEEINDFAETMTISFDEGRILAVILHPKGKAMDSASISFRQEQGLMLRKGQDFPNSFHSGWDSFLRRLTSIHPKRIFMSSKT